MPPDEFIFTSETLVYYLVVTYNGHTFGGSFEIYE